ncbi:hypothetical protein SCHPADRAFT_822027 [Schizopora paradoxa]|uniref:Uncharacterized protein n=1 Tax=Schizopora paradoxa TaxID=27342 RepID=A0A0H2RYG0_9AGAM|nr:hypothetical protein SCHPADRAFT_822027 [Schizopora paradoxa]
MLCSHGTFQRKIVFCSFLTKSQATYSRNRESIADIEEQLYEIFSSHPEAHLDSNEMLEVPANALISVFRIFGERNNGSRLLNEAEEDELNKLLKDNPDMKVTVPVLLQIIVTLTSMSPTEPSGGHDSDEERRGRVYDDESAVHSGSSRSSSRGPPTGPKTPNQSRVPDSPFDSERRQRTAPLQRGAAPSSWYAKRQFPAQRRRSDAGAGGRSFSDSEVQLKPTSTKSNSRPGSRSGHRAPSNPASPRMGSFDTQDASWSTASPPHISSPPMRPHSRARSHGQFDHYGSPDHSEWGSGNFSFMSMPPEGRHRDENSSIMLPPRHNDDEDSDSGEDEDPTLGLVLDRSAKSSLVSMAPQDQLDALQKANTELVRKLQSVEQNMQHRLIDHETEIEDLQNRIEEMKIELSATKREEKELRGKEGRYTHQISTLESEVAKLQRNLETSKVSYQNLQKLYQEQCDESQSLRDALRTRDQQYRDASDKNALHDVEIDKWSQQHEQLTQHLANVEQQLMIAREAEIQLDEQKQENLLLKETIDRLKFDMEELRNKADGNIPSSSGTSSNQNTIGKTLGVEFARMTSGAWKDENEGESDEESESTAVEEEEGHGDSDDTEGEDVIQTIITRKKRKVASRAMKRLETIHLEDVKEYADAYVQHEPEEFSSSLSIQTDPEPKKIMKTFHTQTEVTTNSFSVQTEPEPAPPPPPEKHEMSIQTDASEPESRSRSPSPGEDMASSSSTLMPPTPKQRPIDIFNGDLPPSYAQITGGSDDPADAQTQRDMHVAAEAIRKWHEGLHLPLSPIPGGVSVDAIEEWTALKEELGFDCSAIDKVLEMSLKNGPRSTRDDDLLSSPGAGPSSRRYTRKNRFYNIYNTFVYGSDRDRERKDEDEEDKRRAPGMLQTCAVAGLFALAVSVFTAPYMQAQYSVPGGPTYYDRMAWAEFNRLNPAGEGFVMDGATSIWDFIGRVGGEAARMAARNFPT